MQSPIPPRRFIVLLVSALALNGTKALAEMITLDAVQVTNRSIYQHDDWAADYHESNTTDSSGVVGAMSASVRYDSLEFLGLYTSRYNRTISLFDIDSIPVNQQIESAVLRWNTFNATSPFEGVDQGYIVLDFSASSSSIRVDGPGYGTSVDITSIIQQAYSLNIDPEITLRADTDYTREEYNINVGPIREKEFSFSASGVRIEVTVSPVPEAGSMALAGSALALGTMVTTYRRRKLPRT